VTSPEAPVLLYDGVCGFCAGSVRLILRHERRKTLRFATLQGRLGAAVRSRHPELVGFDSMIWFEPASGTSSERVLVRSDAALEVARYLGGIWTAVKPARLLPRRLRDLAYDLIARHRHRLSGSSESCVVPSAGDRERFLE
jgi:predicted DCC family thiol-disulfide oxidoreductase YuxK